MEYYANLLICQMIDEKSNYIPENATNLNCYNTNTHVAYYIETMEGDLHSEKLSSFWTLDSETYLKTKGTSSEMLFAEQCQCNKYM